MRATAGPGALGDKKNRRRADRFLQQAVKIKLTQRRKGAKRIGRLELAYFPIIVGENWYVIIDYSLRLCVRRFWSSVGICGLELGVLFGVDGLPKIPYRNATRFLTFVRSCSTFPHNMMGGICKAVGATRKMGSNGKLDWAKQGAPPMGWRGSITGVVVACAIGCAVAGTPLFAQAPMRDIDRPSAVEGNLPGKIADLEKRIKELEAAKPAANSLAAPVLPGNDSFGPSPAAETGKVITAGLFSAFGMQDFAPETSPAFPGPLAGFPSPPFANMGNAFTFQSPDGLHTLRITGQVQADYHDYTRHGDTSDIDTFVLRRARLGIEGELFQYYEFRLLPDFGNGKVVMQDCFLNIHYWDEFQFMVGKFKEPVSYEQLILDRFVPTLERSIIDQLMPARDIGLMIHGENLLNDQFEYAIGAFNGEINGDTDTNDIHDFAARIAWKPFNYPVLPDYLHNFQIGVSGTAGKEQEQLSLTGVNNETLRTPGGVPWLTFVKNAYANGIRTRAVPEVSYFYDQFGFMAEYLREDQQIKSGTPEIVTTTTTVTTGKTSKKVTTKQFINDLPEDIRFSGYMFTATYFLTGETRTMYSELIRPLRPFDAAHPFSHPGAWELVARVSHLQVDPSIFRPGAAYQLASPNGNSDAATELTVGFNWYLNSLVRVQCNWEHAWFQQPVLLGPPSNYFRQTDAALLRFQVIF